MKAALDRIQTLAPVAATIACIALAGIIWTPLNKIEPTNVDLVSGDNSQTAVDESADILASGAQSLLERPLFHVTRRQPAAAAQAVQAAPAQVTLSLTGVLNNNDVDIALLRLSNSPELLRRRVGDEVGGWRILTIRQTAVTVLAPNGQEQVIGLSSSSN